jgi:hypothetical protein
VTPEFMEIMSPWFPAEPTNVLPSDDDTGEYGTGEPRRIHELPASVDRYAPSPEVAKRVAPSADDVTAPKLFGLGEVVLSVQVAPLSPDT